MEEVWKAIPGLRCYEASDLGHIRRIGATKPLKGSCNKEGYVQVRLSENNIQFTKKVHRLVALAFLENPNNYPMVNHKNEIRDDNRVDNLEWCTAKYNCHYSAKNIYHDSILHRMKSVIQYDLNLNKIKEFESTRSAAKFLHLNNSHICECCNGVYKTCGGYIFKWKADNDKPSKIGSMAELSIYTKRIRCGFYILQHNGYYVVIQRVENAKWQAHLPSGSFANATSKNDCVLNAINEIDITEDLECDKVAQSPDWWKQEIMFAGVSKQEYPKLKRKRAEKRPDIKAIDVYKMIKSGYKFYDVCKLYNANWNTIKRRYNEASEMLKTDEPVELEGE